MGSPTTALNPSQRQGNLIQGNEARFSDQLLEKARADTDTVLKELLSQLDGLSEVEAATRLKQVGPNEIAREKRQSALMRLLDNVKNPL
jgi:Mg2+-importing ATPase